MVAKSCGIFQINPKLDHEVKSVLLNKGSYRYGTIDNLALFFYVDRIMNTRLGKLIEVAFDKPYRFYNRDQNELQVVKETIEGKNICLYETGDLPNFIAIIGKREVVNRIKMAIRNILCLRLDETVRPLIPISFTLSEKEKEILQTGIFTNIRELSIHGIRDPYVKKAILKGFELERSPEYDKYVRDESRSGMIRFFTVYFRGKVLFISSDGHIYTREAGERDYDFAELAYEVVKKLKDVGAIQYQTFIL